jgi:hypothetical protein
LYYSIPFLRLLLLEQTIAVAMTMVVITTRKTTNTPPANIAMFLNCKSAKIISSNN